MDIIKTLTDNPILKKAFLLQLKTIRHIIQGPYYIMVTLENTMLFYHLYFDLIQLSMQLEKRNERYIKQDVVDEGILFCKECLDKMREIEDFEEDDEENFHFKDSVYPAIMEYFELNFEEIKALIYLVINSGRNYTDFTAKECTKLISYDDEDYDPEIYFRPVFKENGLILYHTNGENNPILEVNPIIMKLSYTLPLVEKDIFEAENTPLYDFLESIKNDYENIDEILKQYKHCNGNVSVELEEDLHDEDWIDLEDLDDIDDDWFDLEDELEEIDMDFEEDESEYEPYTDHLEYVDHRFKWVMYFVLANHESDALADLMGNHNRLELGELRENLDEDNKYTRLLKKYYKKFEVMGAQIQSRIQKNIEQNVKIPRLEKIIREHQLDFFEQLVFCFLLGSVLCKEFERYGVMKHFLTIEDILNLLCLNFEERIQFRKYFYLKANLIKNNLIHYDHEYSFNKSAVDVDKRMIDYILEIEDESDEIAQGSVLINANVRMDQVVISEEKKNRIMQAISNYEIYAEKITQANIDRRNAPLTHPGLVMLFYGPSGTGKTMMANAIANQMNKKLLLVNMPSRYVRDLEKTIRVIFREAVVNNAIIFFDECEDFFESRNLGNDDVKTILTEIEKYQGIVLMATNMPQKIDEAMHRRILLSIEFPKPHFELRENIWEKHLKGRFELADDVDLKALSYEYELTGGLIKNAVLTAIQSAVSRDSNHIVINQEDLRVGAKYQMTKQLCSNENTTEYDPKFGMEHLILPDKIKEQIRDIIDYNKNKQILFSEWGFQSDEAQFK
ncbi:MAG TPA: ATP-binding protein, partial [Candidatus Cloacimonadota bacterium]|nr:ATP-binding protein [Candidatus Cloacimonadota bacterium]